jgi:hypothetical protein
VLLALGVGAALALLLLVGALALFGAPPAGGSARHLDGVAGHRPAAGLLREALELVGRLVDGLEMTLVLALLPGRGYVGVPALGKSAPCKLDVALVERRIDLEKEDRLFDVDDLRHVVLR